MEDKVKKKKTPKQNSKKKKEFLKNLESLRNIWDTMKRNNICIMGISEGEENEQGSKNMFEEIVTTSLVKEKDTQVPEAQKVPNKRDQKRPIPRYIIIKIANLKGKERILEATKEKQLVTYKEAPVRLLSNFSTEVFQARRDWHEIFKVIKSKDL